MAEAQATAGTDLPRQATPQDVRHAGAIRRELLDAKSKEDAADGPFLRAWLGPVLTALGLVITIALFLSKDVEGGLDLTTVRLIVITMTMAAVLTLLLWTYAWVRDLRLVRAKRRVRELELELEELTAP